MDEADAGFQVHDTDDEGSLQGDEAEMKKVCDICGVKFERGLQIKALHKGINPWQKRIFICDKCENVIKLMVLQVRKKREVL